MTDRPLPDVLTIDPDSISSAVLRRLVRELQEDAQLEEEGREELTNYNRSHNRHNRGPNPGHSYNRTHNRHNRGR